MQIMSPDRQQQTLRAIYEKQMEPLQEHLNKMRDRLGDSFEEVLEYPESCKVEELPTEITNAASCNDVMSVVKWLGPRPIAPERINAKNPEKLNRTLLAEAVYEQHVGLMHFLLQEGANVDPKNSYGTTPFRQACCEGLEKAIRILLEWGASKDITADEDITPAQFAMKRGNKALSKLLASDLGGRRCEVYGLQKRVDLNEKTCIVNRYIPQKDRYFVKVERTDEEISVRATNLKRRDRTPVDCGIFYAFGGVHESGRLVWSVHKVLTEAEAEVYRADEAERNAAAAQK